MIEIKVNNTEVVTDDVTRTKHIDGEEIQYEDREVRVRLYGRDRNGDFDSITVTDYDSVFFADTEQVKNIEGALIRTETVEAIDHDTGFVDYKEKTPVSKITVSAPWERKEILEAYPDLNVYWSDVWLDNQLRIDQELFSGVRAPASTVRYDELEMFEADDWADPSITFFDIETDDRGEFTKDGSRPILSIVGYNNYEQAYTGFFWTGEKRSTAECFPDGRPDELDGLWVFDTEREMLDKFLTWVGDTNPDMFTAWNVDFDAGYLHRRLETLNDDAGRGDLRLPAASKLSRENWIKDSYNSVEWKGRTLYDLLHAYKQSKFSELDSYKLDAVAEEELGENKIDHSNMGYHEMWRDDPAHLMEYNAVDVRLCVEINDAADTISFWSTLRDQLGLDFEDTTKTSDFAEMQARRDLWSHKQVAPPADYSRPDGDYDGGYVRDPYNGLAGNVVAVDLSSLYPNTMHMANTSPESKVSEMEARALRLNGTPVCAAPNDVFFRLDEDGVYKRIVDEAIGWKEEYKALRNANADDKELHKKYSERYNVSKTATNAGYGVSGWEPFFLYDEEVAEAITLLGQACIKKTANWINESTVGDVIYGDTDSCYVQLPESWSHEECVDWGIETCETLSDDVYPEFANEEFGIPPEMNRWNIEPEAVISAFFQAGKKKRYAYRSIWKDGKWLDAPSDSVMGFDLKRSDTAAVTKDAQSRFFEAVLDDADREVFEEIVRDAADRIDPTNPDWEAIGIPGGIKREMDDYKTENSHRRGARYMNLLAGTNIGKDSKPKRVELRPTITVGEDFDTEEVDVISFESFEDMPDDVASDLQVDAGVMTNKLIEKPLGPLCEAVGVDVDAAISGQTQSGLGAFV